ncbi:hypothetical protein FLT15_07125 [Paenibacillus thiaminolyticus]|uniref:hypothetical protein n=1 Tax=Paenibacillus thiaminolyticus TaxID=49283 RepID=UPI0011636CBD|nr:hypothetical protein [Paenibacillus thiaminolyticus]NGP58170.1 hypothetical protein [Paenibacillus thiaminolyticus]
MSKYTYLEAEQIANDYEEQVPIKVIAENVNQTFHNGQQIRTVSSVKYVVNRWNNDHEWVDRLENEWHSKVEVVG